MDIQNIAIKFYTSAGHDVDQSQFIPIFQDWIKTQALGEVMIDIADYRHVPDGPGMMLVCHETNYGMDAAEGGQLGLLAQRKQPQAGDHKDRILGVIRGSLKFLSLLEKDPRTPKALKFNVGAFEYISNDRLRVANSDAGLAAIRGDLEAAAAKLYPGKKVSIERRQNHAKSRLAVRVSSGGESSDVQGLLKNL